MKEKPQPTPEKEHNPFDLMYVEGMPQVTQEDIDEMTPKELTEFADAVAQQDPLLLGC